MVEQLLRALAVDQVSLGVKGNKLLGLLFWLVLIDVNHARVVLKNVIQLRLFEFVFPGGLVAITLFEDHSNQRLGADAHVFEE